MAKKNVSSSKPVRPGRVPDKFSPDYVGFVSHPLSPEKGETLRTVEPVSIYTGLETVVHRGYRLTVERRPDGFYQATLYGVDTGTAEDDGIGVSGNGQSPLLAIACVLLKLSELGVLNIHLREVNEDRGVAW